MSGRGRADLARQRSEQTGTLGGLSIDVIVPPLQTFADLAVEPIGLGRGPQVALGVDALRPAVVPEARPPNVDVQRRRFPAPPGTEHAVERVPERFPEVPVEVGVDERVERRVEVPDPEDQRNDNVRIGAPVTQRRDDVPSGWAVGERCSRCGKFIVLLGCLTYCRAGVTGREALFIVHAFNQPSLHW